MRWKRVNPWPQERAGFVVAIDGPSASGKTTVGTRVADRLGADFFDTGVVYRALALLAVEKGIQPHDATRLAGLARTLDLHVRRPTVGDGRLGDVLIGDRDVTWEIRSPAVEELVSRVASLPDVRRALVPVQRRAADASTVVVAGRDIGTVIFPEAPVKVFLEASEEERVRRRAAEAKSLTDLGSVRASMAQRDNLDRTRAISPLEPAPDAVVINTDGIAIEAVVDRICRLADVRRAGVVER